MLTRKDGILGCELIRAQPETNGGEFEHGEIVRGGLFVARGDTSEVFDLVEEVLDEIALFVKLGVERTGLASVGLGGGILAVAPLPSIPSLMPLAS